MVANASACVACVACVWMETGLQSMTIMYILLSHAFSAAPRYKNEHSDDNEVTVDWRRPEDVFVDGVGDSRTARKPPDRHRSGTAELRCAPVRALSEWNYPRTLFHTGHRRMDVVLNESWCGSSERSSGWTVDGRRSPDTRRVAHLQQTHGGNRHLYSS